MTNYLPVGHWSLDFHDFRRPHECPARRGGYHGVRPYSVHLAKQGRWPPPAPVFELTGTPDDLSLFRRWLRHIWLECDAEFGTNTVMGGLPGVGKSHLCRLIGLFLDDGYDEEAQFVYTADELVDANRDLPPNMCIFADEALAEFLWSMMSHDAGQQDVIKEMWEQIRHRKHRLFLVAQQESALAWMIRMGLATWWWALQGRDPVTGQKYGSLMHGVPTWVRNRRTHGYRLERDMDFYFGGAAVLPSLPESEIAPYRERRDEGLKKEKKMLRYEYEPRRLAP